jgi:hypothetical protein
MRPPAGGRQYIYWHPSLRPPLRPYLGNVAKLIRRRRISLKRDHSHPKNPSVKSMAKKHGQKHQQKYPNLNKKGIENFLNSQEVVQVNTKLKGINLKITAKPRTFQIDIMYYKIGQTLKPFLLLIDIMSRKAFCYPISGYKNMTKIITAYKKFLSQVDRVEAIEGDSEFASKEFITLNKEKGIRVDTSVAADNHFTTGNKLGIIDRFTRTLKENIKKYRESIGKIGNLPNIIQSIINMYNDSPHRGIKGKTPNQVWNDTNEQNIQNMKDTISNDKLFNKLTLGIGDTVRVLENKNKFDKGSAQFSKELYEVHDRIGYSFKVKDSDGNVKRRRYKPHELLQVVNMTDVINTDRVKREEKSTNKYKSINKLIRNEDMTRTEARKAMKQVEDVLGPARNTRSQSRKLRNTRT